MLKELDFTPKVLGEKASGRLVDHLVTQTLRGLRHWPTYKLWQDQLLIGDVPIPIRLYLKPLGVVNLKSVDRVKWQDLTFEDPHRGGFDNMDDLAQALRRAGFRFKPLEEYEFFRIRFEWK
jgi:hypothetical protein